ncbi:RNA recognition motif domain containing protein [Acanthamoeba castellanii str. Neff]|uniref:RNA recognition motif domain containing protein n=1 Tax=Acanthamoeba castellanii (strain ATCC 30010 / Neff) TaxID=1257118 RepID=L8GR35_ACACF|nr:RNA recognition motif domain containing protein [Acanthamoeba castellanii str. Neff]ELR14581.1 RNA recognition motif domain containing protein [Acanthamoeba castellanii str. Neff]
MKFKSAAGTNVADGIATAEPPAPAGGKKAREPKRTKIFLRNLSEDTTSMDLEELFSDVGPIRRAFVITKKGERKCSGQGYVQFVMESDAAAAVRQYSGKPFKGSRVLIEVAKPRVRDEKEKRQPKKPVEEVKQEDQDDEGALKDDGYDITKEDEIGKNEPKPVPTPVAKPIAKPVAKPAPPPKREQRKPAPAPLPKREPPPKVEKKVVIVSGLPTSVDEKALEKVLRKYGPITSITYPLGKENTVIAHVEFKDAKFAERASKKCVNVPLGDRTISASFKPEKRDGRLIIRNLPFQATEADLSEKFAAHGKLVDVIIPKNKETGNPRGFGFVEFFTKEEAANALEKVNAQPIRGRRVAVDWCLARESYLKHVIEEEVKAKSDKKDGEKKKAVKKEEVDEEDQKTKKPKVENLDEDESDEDGDSESDEDDDDDDNSEDMDESADSDDSEEEGSEDDDDEELDSDAMVEVKQEKEDDDDTVPVKSEAPAEVEAGTTLFIRNLPFGATVQDLRAKFAEFGRIRYCALVKDKVTGMARGSAFLQFAEKASADSLLAQVALFASQFAAAAAAEPQAATTTSSTTTSTPSASQPKAVLSATVGKSGIFMEGRELQIDRAVDKGTANQFTTATKKETEERDKRNLYLATEGYISPEMGEQMGLSKMEIARRDEAMRAKKQKLKNPNFFVSKTRLSVRNLPKSVTDKQLKKLFLDAVATAPAAAEPGFKKDVRIKQVKIVMGENERSKGFGFVEFEDHDHALIGLREVNNSPKYFGEKRRLLVEFALEDKRVVEGRQKRLQLQQVKQKKLRALDEQEARDGTAKRKPAAQAQAQQQKGGNKKAPNSAASPQKPKPQPQQPAGQKRKREDSNNGSGNNKKAAVKNDNKAGKEGARQQKKQKVAPPQQQQDEKSQPQRKRAREVEADALPALSRKARAAVKKRKDIDALDSMVTQYKERLFASPVAKEATKRWFE